VEFLQNVVLGRVLEENGDFGDGKSLAFSVGHGGVHSQTGVGDG